MTDSQGTRTMLGVFIPRLSATQQQGAALDSSSTALASNLSASNISQTTDITTTPPFEFFHTELEPDQLFPDCLHSLPLTHPRPAHLSSNPSSLNSRPVPPSFDSSGSSFTIHPTGSRPVYTGLRATVVGLNGLGQSTTERPVRTTAYRGSMLNDVDPVARRYMHETFSVVGNWELEENEGLEDIVIANPADRDPSTEDWLKYYIQDYPQYVYTGCLRGGTHLNLDWNRFPVFAQLIQGSTASQLQRNPRVSLRAHPIKPNGERWSDKADWETQIDCVNATDEVCQLENMYDLYLWVFAKTQEQQVAANIA
ncbi:hypothetical protein MMC17_009442 [Xylographa soralifera]|nr:hypothetical protein [Xylographa soralifera]